LIVNNPEVYAPLLSSEFDELMYSIGYFEPAPTLAVAVSGGADSIALLYLTNNYARARNGRVVAITVNHNLRLEAEDEAKQVKKWCIKQDIEHHILYWQPPSPIISSIQENARNARYQLMLDWCRKNNILHLLTAHHLDDQVETMFFRLARGSGLEGLSAMSAQNIVGGVRLLRPLLSIPKIRLLATLEQEKQTWIEDSSNQNSIYTRVHIRQQLAQAKDNIILKERSNVVASKLGIFRNLLENNLVSQITNSVFIFSKGYVSINFHKFNKLENEVTLKALGNLIRTLSGSKHLPRTNKLEQLNNLIRSNRLNSKYSVGGLLFETVKDHILVYREDKAIEGPIIIEPGIATLWDRRFVVKISSDKKNTTPVRVQKLGSKGLAEVRKNAGHLLKNMPPDRIIRTFPSLWSLEELLSVPHISYINEQSKTLNTITEIQFHPAKPLADSCFFVMNS
jgi:tRNA(Ile)-lysidine synthase